MGIVRMDSLDDVSVALNWTSHLPTGQFIFVRDTVEAEGGFLVNHLIDEFVKTSNSVCLVGLAQTKLHYIAVSKKLGHNVSNAQFHFIDDLSQSPGVSLLGNEGLGNLY